MTRLKQFYQSQLSKSKSFEELVDEWLQINNNVKIISFQVVEHKGNLVLYLLYDILEENNESS